MKVWERLGFPSQQHYAARCRVNKRRIAEINARLDELGWFYGKPSEEGDRLDEEKGRLVDEIVPQPTIPTLPNLELGET